jgi:aspartyl-tRNA(Asn)/glutamyl-tRNA(Gln) amidotransferase subunit C
MSGDSPIAVEPLSTEQVRKVARLARLKLTEAELKMFTAQLGQILGYVHVLDRLDTEIVEPMSHAVDLSNIFREDVPKDSLSREAALANAPKSDGAAFLVPPILDAG